ncbi:helix-turn-helix domain-containing protein [Streptomyces phaeolivaceus]|uniref:Helix-turn-helix domain-containing protein n=1 Tax=Streptomyces phaeolivaceus TaxID=2653200 RepID=A0A5P8JWL7_9ACTN|nr:helix-turn-helix transcriptional regulator [Streptomyces phaeolivaceus]QFQ95176.1 helix-turn-helix domain-containing protein [Streptomyces phaeolivaceus]
MSAAPDDVREFAAALTRIKERTDRSYGQLARRLNMNTSTLHRYCAGDTVPLDFAPVERFAALCGATPEERLELHRLWLPAVAARQRARTGGGAASGPTAPEPAGPAESGEEAEPVEEVEPVGSAAPTEPTEPAESAESPESVQAIDLTTPTASVGPDDVPESVPSARRPWHRRRRTLVSAAVVAVLVATLGSLTVLPSGGSPGDGDAQGGEPAPSRTTSGAQRPSTGPTSPSPSPDTSGGTKSPSPTPTPTSSAEPEDDPTKGDDTRATRPPATGVPLTWTANSQLWALGCGHDYVVAKPPKEVPPPPAPQDAGVWAATQQGVHGRNTIVEITVQGRKSTAVVLTALRVRVVGRAAPAKGNSYAMDQGCGGRVSPRYFDVDLDKDRPIARPVDGADLDVRIPAVRLPYQVSADDPEVLMISAETETCDCGWYLELEWSSEGRTGTVRIDDAGRPFRTTAIKGLPRYGYDTLNRRWSSLSD